MYWYRRSKLEEIKEWSSVTYPEFWRSPEGDAASPAGDAESLSGDAVIFHWRCIISIRDAHPPHPHSHLSQ